MFPFPEATAPRCKVVAKMPKKKSKKKKKKNRDRSTSFSYESNDESSKEKEYNKTKETPERKYTSSCHVRPMQDEEGRTRQVDSVPSPKKISSERSPRKDRQYKKPVYRLGTVSHSEKEKDHSKTVKEKHSTSGSASISENASKKPHCTEKSHLETTAAGEPVKKRHSEELKELPRQVAKRRSKEALEYDRFVPCSQGKGAKEHSQEPKSQPAAFSRMVNSLTKVSREPPKHSEELKEQRRQLVKRRSRESLESDRFVPCSQGKGAKEHSQEPKSQPAPFSGMVNSLIAVSREPPKNSEELKEQRRQLVKRRSKEALEYDRFVPRCLGKGGKEHSQEPKSQPAAFSGIVNSLIAVSREPPKNSEELKEQRRQLVKRRSKEALESDRFVPCSQGKGAKEHSQEPKSQPAAFSGMVNSLTAVSREPPKHSESSYPSGNGQKEKAWLKPHKPLQFKISKKINVVVNKDEVWKSSSFRDVKESIAAKVPRPSPQAENVSSACTFSDRKSIVEKARPSCEVNLTSSHIVRASLSPSRRHQEALGTDNKRVAAFDTTALPEKIPSSRVPSKATETYDSDQEMQLVAELHRARSQKLLEVNVVDSYGELTCMEIDPPEEISTSSSSTEHIQQDLLIILDTNILLSHLDFVKKIRSHGLGGFPVILIPWVVMQELDALKHGKHGKLHTNVEHKARPAVHYIYTALKNQEPRLWGQSMQQASLRICGLDAENNDDRVLHCCLQYQELCPGVALILCTNDKNLCSKALLSGVKALSKADLASEVERLQSDTQTHGSQHLPARWPPHTADPGIQSQPDERREGDRIRAAEEARQVSTSVAVLEEALQGALSLILESEMKAAFDDLWLEVVLKKPPWTLSDLMQCFRKHWIAVFGDIVKRSLLSSVECLNDSLCKGKMLDRDSTKLAAQEARRLLLAFSCRLDYGKSLAKPLAVVERLLQDPPQPTGGAEQASGSRARTSSDGEMLMAVEEGVTDVRPSCQEVWAVFENIWINVCQISSAVFTALRFVPGTLDTSIPSDDPPPPQEALSCLHKLIFTVRQLLESLQRVLSAKSSFEDVQALLTFISSSEIVTVKPSFTAKDLFECVSQQEYREKLCVGGSQLMDLSSSLDRCASAVGHWAGSSSWT